MSRFATVITRNAPFTALASPREAIRQFTPNWFAVTMGTGILSLALAQLPGNVAVLRDAGEALWFLNVALFALFSVMYASRWLLFF
ncbi:C4-dicarboxylate transporter/malic acid transport protein, partial [Pseudomonas syringae pv. actinidiae ICMP 18807]